MSAPGVARRPAAGVGTLVLLGTLLVQLGWLLALPPFAGIDEVDHSFRASSVALGHVRPDYVTLTPDRGRGDLIPVRADIARAAQAPCQALPYNLEANCVPTRTLGSDQVLIGSAAARYDPAFYLATGWLSRPFQGDQALYAMRVVGALLSAALLAWTASVVAARSRTAWPTLMLLVAATPIVLYSTTVASPNGLHMVAGLGVWAALLGLFSADPPTDRDRASLLALGAVSAVVELVTHSLGVLWLALTVVAVLTLVGLRRARERIRDAPRGPLAAATAFVVVGGLLAGAWILAARTNDPTAEPLTGNSNFLPPVLRGMILWPLQAIAAFPSREQVANPLVYVLVLVLVLAPAALAVRRATTRERLVLLGIVVVSLAVPALLTAATFSHLGAAWQGRYGIPFSAGAVLLVGEVLDRTVRSPAPVLLLGAAAALGVSEVLSWTSVVHQVLRNELWRTTDRWDQPALVLLVLLAVAGAAAWAGALILTGRSRDA